MKTLLWLFVGFLLPFGVWAEDDCDPSDESYSDWAHTAQVAEELAVPVVIVFVSDDCGYCELLKDTFLNPEREQGALARRAVLRSMDIHADGKLDDFDGERIRARHFIKRYGVFATPTVVMVDYAGNPLAEPLVGFNGPAAYRALFEDALTQATALLRTPDPDANTVAQAGN